MVGNSVSAMRRLPLVQSRKHLYLTALAGNLLYISIGCVMAWPSPSLPVLEKKWGLSQESQSWVGSIYGLGAALGPVVTYLCLDRLGRKNSCMLAAAVFLLSWLFVTLAPSLPLLLAGRVIGGIGVGATFSSMSVYLAEIADNEVRGAVGAMNQGFVGLGLLLEYGLGMQGLSPSWLGAASASFTLLFLASYLKAPESPYLLVARGDSAGAVQALCWLRGGLSPPQVQRELQSIQESVSVKGEGWAGLVSRRGARRALLVCLWTMFCQQVSGINVILSFTQEIFHMATESISSDISSVIIGCVNVVSSVLAVPLVRRWGLKNILVISCFGMASSQVLMSIYFYLQSQGDMRDFSWLPITCLVVFNFCFCFGAGPLPWASVAELFPAGVKAPASCLVGVYVWLIAFLLMKEFLIVVEWAGQWPVFLSLGVGGLVGAVGLAFFLPDTRGLSFIEIHEMMEGRKLENRDGADTE